ncbi:hypothetical protein HAP48_0005735 [Bradyrhizobium septentrionale]|nr:MULTISPECIES: hypothetical protein [Bradyrhizobium]MCK7667411.1 hypothetical protein [Bradyrhizobium sp. 2S1]UGY16970.1 hypothetical protein HAP48_0005735 [Bradyrhizobium septentrionale]UGY25721.1 hypothetical protein HU675_0002500 [Bradyrhizobium septentrionale]
MLTALVDLGLDRSDAGLDFLEDKGLLFIVTVRRAELFRFVGRTGRGRRTFRICVSRSIRASASALRALIGDFALQSIGAGRLSAIASTMALSIFTSFGRL